MSRVASPRRIAYLASAFPAVSHTFILREIEALRAQGHTVLPCSVRPTPPDQHKGEAEQAFAAETFNILGQKGMLGVVLAAQIWALGRPRAYLRVLIKALRLSAPGLRAHLYQLIYAVEATILARHLSQKGVTQIHNHFANSAATVAMLAAELIGAEFSFTLHGPSDLREPDRTRLDAKIAAARFVSCISHYARSQAMLHSDPQDWPKLKIVHCGVVPERYAGAPDAAAQPPNFIFVGRLAPVKGLRVLMEAFAQARASVPDMTLTIVGDGPDREWLVDAAAPFGAAVRLTGALSQDAVADALARARAMVLPSFAEGVPVVLMEAMASARPVITTQITGIPELVEHDRSGLLLPPGDGAALAGAMVALARDPARCAEMGQVGRARVAAEYDIAQEAKRIAALFEGDLPEGPRAR